MKRLLGGFGRDYLGMLLILSASFPCLVGQILGEAS